MAELLQPLQAIGQLLDAGGWVLWVIMAATFWLWCLIVERLCFIHWIYPRLARGWIRDWQGRAEHASWLAHRIREGVIVDARLLLSARLGLIKTLIGVSPLLGLLGTVTGMIEVFDVMALSGTGNARSMAGGVSRATIPTMAGMVVALTGLFFGSRFDARVRRETRKLADALRLKP